MLAKGICIFLVFISNAEDDSGCESDVSSNDSIQEVLNNHPRHKRRKKYGYAQNDDNVSIRYKVTHKIKTFLIKVGFKYPDNIRMNTNR